MAKLVFNPSTGQLDIQAGSNTCTDCEGHTQVLYKEAGEFTDITETEILSYTSVSDRETFTRFFGSAQTFGVWRIYNGSVSPANLEFEFRTSEMHRNLNVSLRSGVSLATTGNMLKITFEAYRYRSAILGATATTFTRIEGSY